MNFGAGFVKEAGPFRIMAARLKQPAASVKNRNAVFARCGEGFGANKKICALYFKIGPTNFKISQTFFCPLPNPHEQRPCRYMLNADKKRTFFYGRPFDKECACNASETTAFITSYIHSRPAGLTNTPAA